jgi:predicted Zn-dependent protease
MSLGVEVTDQELKALLEVGFLHRERGEVKQAREVFEGVLALRPDLGVAKVGLANVLQLGGDDAGAEAVLREAAEAQPDNAFVQQQLGELLHTLGRKEDALAALDKAIELDAGGPNAAAAQAIKDVVEADIQYTYRAPGVE